MDGYDPQISYDRFIANLTHMFPMIDVVSCNLPVYHGQKKTKHPGHIFCEGNGDNGDNPLVEYQHL